MRPWTLRSGRIFFDGLQTYTARVDPASFEEHLSAPHARGAAVAGGFSGSAGGAACGDLIRFTLRVEGDRVAAAGFEASGCGALTAAGSAAATLVDGEPLLDAARVGAHAIAAELGGLSPGKFHAADLAADALHGALGRATRAGAAVPADPDRTLVAMSGGVDSAVAALLVGEGAVAVTLELWADPENDAEASCCSAHAVRVARSVAHGMGMPHFTLDLREEFRAGVVDPFLAGYAGGVTPNPCVGCNGHVRLDAMVAFADALGAATLATGHYARVTGDGLLRAAADPAKDQTYMLAAVTPATLARLRFPLGELTKPRVRELAAEAGLPVASKAESQDLCFLAGTGKAAFLARHAGLEDKTGEIVDEQGRVLAQHRGAHHFTVGQRKGLGVAAPEPLYVLATDARANRVVAGPRTSLATSAVRLRGARLHRAAEEVDRVKLRYRSRALPCRATQRERGRVELELLEPVDGAAPGQTACLLRGDVVVGWGTISAA
jgi:tRNA-uridine 2-sulfurtransferase